MVDSLPASRWGGWGVTSDAVVHLGLTGRSTTPASGATRVTAALRHRPAAWDGTLGVSPDGKYAVVAEVERSGSEIHLRPER